MSPKQLEEGHRGAYRDFYSWANIWRAARACGDTRQRARHVAYTAGWRKLEPVWDVAIRTCHVHRFLPLLEAVLDQPSPHASAWRAAAAWVGPSLSGRFPVRSVR